MLKLLTNHISKRYNAASIKGKAAITLGQYADFNKNGYIIVKGTMNYA